MTIGGLLLLLNLVALAALHMNIWPGSVSKFGFGKKVLGHFLKVFSWIQPSPPNVEGAGDDK